MKPAELFVSRNHGHPWDGRPGFDLMEVRCADEKEWESFQKKACAKFWEVWVGGEISLCGNKFFGGVSTSRQEQRVRGQTLLITRTLEIDVHGQPSGWPFLCKKTNRRVVVITNIHHCMRLI